MNDPRDMMAGYFEGTLSAEQVAALEAWLLADYGRMRDLVREAALDTHLGQLLREKNLHDIAGDLSEDSPFGALLGALDAPAGAAELVDLSRQAESVTIEHGPQDDAGSLSRGDLVAVGGYLLGKALTSKPVIYSAAAAIVLFALSLAIVYTTGLEQPVVVQAPANDGPGFVATLTDESDAQWSRGDHALGDALQPGEMLRLTRGFVEITTESGAVAVLEAPCTIELLDNDNAIRLHAGKLVAQVPGKAKGFTVQTPTAKVVDFGTRFGVEVEQDGATHTAVFLGKVELREHSDDQGSPTRSVRLTEGWAARVSSQGDLQRNPVALSAEDHGRYAQSMKDAASPGLAYRRMVLASRPLVYWGFDEAQDHTANLVGQRDFNGQAIGQTTHAPGLFGSALKLTGEPQTMGGFTSKNTIDLSDVEGYTLEAWCRIDRPHHGRVLTLAAILAPQDPKHHSFGVLEVVDGDDVPPSLKAYSPAVRFIHRRSPSLKSNTGENIFTSNGAPTGQWVHIAAVRDGMRARIYLNGSLASASDDDQPAQLSKAMRLLVGISPIILRPDKSTNPSEFRCFNGLVDEVAVYGHALSHQTIQSHYRLGRAEGGQPTP